MCLDHSLRLYLRGLHTFKMLVAVYMVWPAIELLTDEMISMTYGSDMAPVGGIVLLMALAKPCNVGVGIYGSKHHNKFALVMIMTFDLAMGVLQFTIGLLLLLRGTPEFDYDIRHACVANEIDGGMTKKCDEYWYADRTAGMRLAWESMYYQGADKGDSAMVKQLGAQQDAGICCGFGPPSMCHRIYNKEKFPDNLKQDELISKAMLKQRVICSEASLVDVCEEDFACWYPGQPGTCQHYAPSDVSQANVLGCRYDFGIGSCLSLDVTGDTLGCAAQFEEFMNSKIYYHGWIFLTSLILELLTIVSACCFCWKRKEDDVLPITFIYDEPYDPVKAGKLNLHLPQGASMASADISED